jgi:uncharacterized protein (UPF0332 family)
MLALLFHQFAVTLAHDDSLGAAEYRSAISRTYYAAHHTARAFLIGLGVKPPAGPQGHGAIWNALLAAQDQDVVDAGSELRDLHAERRRADYELGDRSVETQASAVAAVTLADEIILALNNCRNDLVRKAQVMAAIKAWVGAMPGGGGYTVTP